MANKRPPQSNPSDLPTELKAALGRNLIFIGGKGGVGKTVFSRALARHLSKKGRVLWATFEDPTLPLGILEKKSDTLFEMNCEAGQAFEEYAAIKIGFGGLAKVFLQNKLVRYLAKAAPGVHELVLLGKVWFERNNYDQVIVDLPSTGYGLAMFQSAQNFSDLFRGGPIQRDADAMLDTFRDPGLTAHIIMSLPEEMPLQEGIELDRYLTGLFPNNRAAFVVNRVFPNESPKESPEESDATSLPSTAPLSRNTAEYCERRVALERLNLKIWKDHKFSFSIFNYMPGDRSAVIQALASELPQ
jgi:hypothetical protein